MSNGMCKDVCSTRSNAAKNCGVLPPERPLRALSILRVSTERQMREGDGIENQRRCNNVYIDRKEYQLVKEFELAESASSEKRVDFDKVIDYTVTNRDKIDVWIMYKVDRLSRGGLATYATHLFYLDL